MDVPAASGTAAAAASTAKQTAVTAAVEAIRVEAASNEVQAYSDPIKRKFNTLLAEFVDQLSEDDFAPLCEKLVNIDSSLTAGDFVLSAREQLLPIFRQCVDFFWQTSNVDDNLVVLREVLRTSKAATAAAAAEGRPAPVAWRPTGKTAAEQVRVFRVALIQAKIAFLQTQTQNPVQMQNLVIKVEERRERMEQMQLRRSKLQQQIELRLKELEQANAELTTIAVELCDVDRMKLY